MANLREPYASTSLAGLGWDENREKAIDRVAAAGLASTLGIALWKAKYLIESAAMRKASDALLKMFRQRYAAEPPEIALALVEQAMVEWIAPQCRTCNGEGERLVNELKVLCEACAGSKVHCYTDTERARRMQISYAKTKACSHKILWLIGVMEAEDREVNHQMQVALERLQVNES